MRHRRNTLKLSRTNAHRRLMFRNMLNSLIQHERIQTTLPKAKALRQFADRIITLGKRPQGENERVPEHTLRRRAFDELRDRGSVGKLFDDLAPRYKEREGGYTRIIKLGHRRGDNAEMALVEFVEAGSGATGAKKKRKKKSAAAKSGEGKPSTKKEAAPEAAAASETPAESVGEEAKSE